MKIKRVAIVGGTHGNELTGVVLVRKFLQYPELVHRQSFETISLLANPRSIALNRRYIDRDLNRCFDRHDLANLELTGYENNLAKQFAARYGANGSGPVDVIIDLHSTTANMGLTVVPINNSPANLQLVAYLSSLNPAINIYLRLNSEQDSPTLQSVASLGCMIVVGAIPQGVIEANFIKNTERLVLDILDYFEYLNRGVAMNIPATVNLYQAIESIDYPRNGQNELMAMIHPDRQGQDYQAMAPKSPLFMNFQGETILAKNDCIIFPVFINEAAYYEKGIAMMITEKRNVSLLPL
jgi:succinylglutamate desuccinylase